MRFGRTLPHEIQNAPEDAHGQVPQHVQLQLPPRPGETAHETGADAVGCKCNIADMLRPEEEPPDSQNVEVDSRSPVETERCRGPRAAKSKKRARMTKGGEDGVHLAGWVPCGGCSGRPGPRQIGPGTKRLIGESWTFHGRQHVLVSILLVSRFLC